MTTTSCFLGLGSNQQQPIQQLQTAIKAIHALQNSKVTNQSSFYQSKPLQTDDENKSSQQDYVNAVIQLETQLTPFELLHSLQQIENQQGRRRDSENRWAPRTLDLDILLYDDKVIQTQKLIVPHYAMKQRDFVLQPLLEISPDVVLPDGSLPRQLLQQCEDNHLRKITG